MLFKRHQVKGQEKEKQRNIDMETEDLEGKSKRVLPSKDNELTGGLMMVIRATPSAPTSISVLPMLLLSPLLPCNCDHNY